MKEVIIVGGEPITLHYNNWLPRLFGGVNTCITLNGSNIRISRDWITPKGLAHEVGHIFQARALGWKYLPWVLWCYVRHGYRNSPAEVGADVYMEANHRYFLPHGPVPSWIRDQ